MKARGIQTEHSSSYCCYYYYYYSGKASHISLTGLETFLLQGERINPWGIPGLIGKPQSHFSVKMSFKI